MGLAFNYLTVIKGQKIYPTIGACQALTSVTDHRSGSKVDPMAAQVAAQAREYERLSQAHRSRQRQKNASVAATRAPSSNNDTTTSPSSFSSDDENEKEGSGSTTAFYLATSLPTKYNSKPVRCIHCKASLHTHPLAVNYFCQRCFQITSLLKKEEGDSVEGKIMDVEDNAGEEVGRYPIGKVSSDGKAHFRGWR